MIIDAMPTTDCAYRLRALLQQSIAREAGRRIAQRYRTDARQDELSMGAMFDLDHDEDEVEDYDDDPQPDDVEDGDEELEEQGDAVIPFAGSTARCRGMWPASMRCTQRAACGSIIPP